MYHYFNKKHQPELHQQIQAQTQSQSLDLISLKQQVFKFDPFTTTSNHHQPIHQQYHQPQYCAHLGEAVPNAGLYGTGRGSSKDRERYGKEKIIGYSNRSSYAGGNRVSEGGDGGQGDAGVKVKFRNTMNNSFGILRSNANNNVIAHHKMVESEQQDHSSFKPKIPCKKIFDDPKFLLSLQRKKVRVINGLQNSELDISSQPQRPQFRNPKKKQLKNHNPRPKIFSQPQRLPQNYTHTSLNLKSAQSHRISKTPYLNFNLHLLIKERKQLQTELETYQSYNHNQSQRGKMENVEGGENGKGKVYEVGNQFNVRIGKKGTNLPYYAGWKSQKVGIDRDKKQEVELPLQNTNIRQQIRTAKTHQRTRNTHNKSTTHDKRPYIGQHVPIAQHPPISQHREQQQQLKQQEI